MAKKIVINDENMSFGGRLAYVRKRRHLTQEELEQAIHRGDGYISDIERDRHMPSLEIFIEILNVLEVPADLVLGRTVQMEDAQPSNTRVILELLSDCSPRQLAILTDMLRENKRVLFDHKV